MIENGNYPIGAECCSDAPWNDSERKIEVTVSLTISKTLTISLPENKFYAEQDEDGSYIECTDLTEQDFIDAVRKQYTLPHEELDWNEDEICVSLG